MCRALIWCKITLSCLSSYIVCFSFNAWQTHQFQSLTITRLGFVRFEEHILHYSQLIPSHTNRIILKLWIGHTYSKRYDAKNISFSAVAAAIHTWKTTLDVSRLQYLTISKNICLDTPRRSNIYFHFKFKSNGGTLRWRWL